MRVVWLSWLLLLALTACVQHVPMAVDYPGPTALPPSAYPVEAQESVPIIVRGDEHRRRLAGVTVRQLGVQPGTSADSGVEFAYYDVDGDERKPVVVLLPIFDGDLTVTRFFARYFASQGWAAVLVNRSRDALVGLRSPEQAIRASLGDYRRVLDWVERQPELDTGRIGLFGISFGAMDAVMLTALDDRVDALVVAMAGGDLPYVMLNTNYRRVARIVDDLAADEGLTRDGLRASLEADIETDPLALAPYVDAQRVLMILTRTDAIVPFEAQQALRARMGAPESMYLPTGHRFSALYLPKVRSSAYEFFARQFAVANLAVARN